MDFYEAQQQFAEFIKSAVNKVNAYYWRLSGDAPNSFCKFLCLEEEELKRILRLCKVYHAEFNDNFARTNFEMLMMMCKPNVDWVTYKPPLSGKPERFIKIGRGGEGLRPKEFYDLEGNLLKYPVQDENILNLRTKSQKNVLTILLAAAPASRTTKNNDETPSPITKKSTMLPSPSKTISPKGMLFEYIRELIAEAGAAPKSSDRTWRTLLQYADF
jgi:hypothetical protein